MTKTSRRKNPTENGWVFDVGGGGRLPAAKIVR
jgi:hypothetical protein